MSLNFNPQQRVVFQKAAVGLTLTNVHQMQGLLNIVPHWVVITMMPGPVLLAIHERPRKVHADEYFLECEDMHSKKFGIAILPAALLAPVLTGGMFSLCAIAEDSAILVTMDKPFFGPSIDEKIAEADKECEEVEDEDEEYW